MGLATGAGAVGVPGAERREQIPRSVIHPAGADAYSVPADAPAATGISTTADAAAANPLNGPTTTASTEHAEQSTTAANASRSIPSKRTTGTAQRPKHPTPAKPPTAPDANGPEPTAEHAARPLHRLTQHALRQRDAKRAPAATHAATRARPEPAPGSFGQATAAAIPAAAGLRSKDLNVSRSNHAPGTGSERRCGYGYGYGTEADRVAASRAANANAYVAEFAGGGPDVREWGREVVERTWPGVFDGVCVGRYGSLICFRARGENLPMHMHMAVFFFSFFVSEVK